MYRSNCGWNEGKGEFSMTTGGAIVFFPGFGENVACERLHAALRSWNFLSTTVRFYVCFTRYHHDRFPRWCDVVLLLKLTIYVVVI